MASEIVRKLSGDRRTFIISIIVAAVAVIFITRYLMSMGDPQGQVIKVGAILPRTGAGAVFSQYIEEGINLAVDEINAADSPRIKILYEDSKNQPREGVVAYNKLVATETPPVVIVALSSVAKALAPLADEGNTSQVYIAVAIPNITDGRHRFRIYPEAIGMTDVIAKYNAEKLGARTSAVIYINDEYGRVSMDAYKQKFEEYDGRIVFAESYELQQTDFRSQISKLKQITPAPDVIFLCGYGASYSAVVRQLKEQQVQSQITADMTMGLADTLAQIGEASENVHFIDGKVSEEFGRRFRERYNKEPSSYAGYSYDIVRLIHQTAKGKQTFTADTVRDGLLAVKDYPGAMGRVTVNEKGDSQLRFVVKQIRQQTPIIVSE